MPRLPQPGADSGVWGNILNEFLSVALQANGSLKRDSDITDAQTKANSAVQSVNGKTGGTITLTADDVGAIGQSAPTVTAPLTINGTNAGSSGTLLINDSAGNPGLTLGGDTRLFRSGSAQLQTPDALFVVRATLGVVALGVTTSGDATRRFQINTDGRLLWSAGSGPQDTIISRNASGGLQLIGTAGTTLSPATPVTTVDGSQAGVVQSSSTGGGVLLVKSGNNPGAGLNVHGSRNSSATGRLVNITESGTDSPVAGMHVDYAGVANGVEISYTGTGNNGSTGPGTGQALNVVSTNQYDTAFGVDGREMGRGTAKITHTIPASANPGDDATASALSLRVNGAGTAAQGIFLDSDTGGTTGNLLTLRNGGFANQRLRLDASGNLMVDASIQIGDGTATDVGGGQGVLGFKEATTVPTTNPAAGGAILYAEQGILKWRNPSGTVYILDGNSTATPDAQPGEQSYIGWNYDPIAAANNFAPTAGTPVLIKLKAQTTATAANICLNVNNGGSGFTADTSYAALFDMAGAQLGFSADLAGTLATPGAKTIPLTATGAGTLDVVAGNFYYIWFVVNASTMPTFNRSGNVGAINQNLAAGTYRFATLGSSISSVPASLTLGGSVALSVSYWAALS